MKVQVLKVLLDHGTLIEPDAAEYIMSRRNPLGFVKAFLENREEIPLVLRIEDVRGSESVLDYEHELPAIDEPDKATAESQRPLDEATALSRPPRETGRVGEGLRIITDITGNSTCDGSIENFTEYFRDRFTVLRRILKARVEMSGFVKIKRAVSFDRDVKIIGMVSDVGVTKNGHTSMTLEDDSGSIFTLIPKGHELQSEVILKDEVMGIVGRMSGRGSGPRGRSQMLIPRNILRPDIPVNRSPRRSEKDIEVVFLADIHVGSSHFLQEAWERLVEWLSGRGASKVGYAIVAGDLVDGIGVYPNQQDELDIPDIVAQYAKLAELLKPVPERITLLLQPGNHDAVRLAEPQPALPERFQKLFGPSARFIGNPCYFSIEGVEILAYHGRSIDDLVGTIPGIRYQTPNEAMLEMLKRRHLLVTYGAKTPIAPEAKDYMVINPVPDIFVTGHVHRTSVERFRGMTLINASAWQSQTPYQMMHNFHPDPGKAVVVNLKTGRCRVKDFLGDRPNSSM